MKGKVTLPDGSVLELEGTPTEIAKALEKIPKVVNIVNTEIEAPTAEAIAQTAQHVASHPSFSGVPVIGADENADETIPFALPETKIDLIKGVDWNHRSRRNVFMDMGNGRRTLVWRRGVKIPREEAQRQKQTWHYAPCTRCGASGTVAGDNLQTYPCPDCRGVREIRVEGL